ncbi:MAG: hypothetical protein IPJ65_33720 [Archangiaceae bacterium]|nr:hypothetical protein [Archangiaceae bacterium]
MTCEDLELSVLTEEALNDEARAHLASCARCQAFQSGSAQLLADAALPEPTAEEKAALAGLAPRLLQGWRVVDRRRSFARRALGLAVAACVGAAVASAALLPHLQPRVPFAPAGDTVTASEWPLESGLASSSDTEDELDAYEVSWPSP